jgi:hypothetical protein
MNATLCELLDLAIGASNGRAIHTILMRAEMANTSIPRYIFHALTHELRQPPESRQPLPEGVTVVPLDDPAVMHDAIAGAVGEAPARPRFYHDIMGPVFTPIRAGNWPRIDVIPNGMTATPEQVEDLLWDLVEGDLKDKTLVEINAENPSLARFVKTVHSAHHRWQVQNGG